MRQVTVDLIHYTWRNPKHCWWQCTCREFRVVLVSEVASKIEPNPKHAWRQMGDRQFWFMMHWATGIHTTKIKEKRQQSHDNSRHVETSRMPGMMRWDSRLLLRWKHSCLWLTAAGTWQVAAGPVGGIGPETGVQGSWHVTPSHDMSWPEQT